MCVFKQILILCFCVVLSSCGGGGSESASSDNSGGQVSGGGSSSGDGSSDGNGSGDGTSEQPQDSGFAELQVDTGFDWQMDERADLSFELVSLISQGRASGYYNQSRSADGWLSISGRYVVNVFAIDGDGNVLTNAIFTGMTNQYGQLAVNFNLVDTWLGVVVDVDLDDQSCSQSIYRDELANLVQLGCDIAVGSDL